MKANHENFMQATGNGLHISGYLRTSLYQKGYGSIGSDTEKKVLIKNQWNSIINSHRTNKSSKYVGVRPIIFSPNPKEFKGLTKEEQTHFMQEFTTRSMRNFQRQFLETGDQLGYIYSVHTDKEHVHSHVYLLPYSKKGLYLAMNAPKFFNKLQREKTGRAFAAKKTTESSRALWLKSHNKSLFKSLLRSYMALKNGIAITPVVKRRRKNLELEI